MDNDLVLSLVLFGLLFFGLFFCYYSAQVRIKRDERALAACERRLLQYHQHQHLFFGQPNIYSVSGNTDQSHLNEMPPEYGKVGIPPPPYDLVMASNPPPYSVALQRECNACAPVRATNQIANTRSTDCVIIEEPEPGPEQDSGNLTSIQVIPRNETFSSTEGATNGVTSSTLLTQTHSVSQ